MKAERPAGAEFDAWAGAYKAALQRGVSLSGEDATYFARARVAWLKHCLEQAGVAPRRIVDYGCGVGSEIPFLDVMLAPATLVGIDVSSGSLDVARRSMGSERIRFARPDEHEPAGDADLAYTNGTFHHIPPADRAGALDYLYRSLQPGGLLALWENNPWNPGTRLVMRRIAFDRDAVPVSVSEARRLLTRAGFEVCRIDFLFIFPRMLRALRCLEPWCARWPFGAQYQILARRPADSQETRGAKMGSGCEPGVQAFVVRRSGSGRGES